MRAMTMLLTLSMMLVLTSADVRAQSSEDETVKESTQVLREIMEIPGKGIPESLLAGCQGLVIVPGMFKGGFVVGVKHGDGVFLTREANGTWRSPVFVSITGGSVGFQAGVQRTDVILVFRNKTSAEAMMRGKFTIGADASVAAGPVGREAAAATDGQFKAEILSYSRSRGLFAGVSLDGSVITLDNRASATYYAPRAGQPAYPPSAAKLIELIAAYSNPAKGPAVVAPLPSSNPNERDVVLQQLTTAHQQLQAILDGQWKQYLTLPLSVPPAIDALKQSQVRYDTIAADPQYRTLAERREFQDTLRLLHRYNALLAASPANILNLPAPPK